METKFSMDESNTTAASHNYSAILESTDDPSISGDRFLNIGHCSPPPFNFIELDNFQQQPENCVEDESVENKLVDTLNVDVTGYSEDNSFCRKFRKSSPDHDASQELQSVETPKKVPGIVIQSQITTTQLQVDPESKSCPTEEIHATFRVIDQTLAYPEDSILKSSKIPYGWIKKSLTSGEDIFIHLESGFTVNSIEEISQKSNPPHNKKLLDVVRDRGSFPENTGMDKPNIKSDQANQLIQSWKNPVIKSIEDNILSTVSKPDGGGRTVNAVENMKFDKSVFQNLKVLYQLDNKVIVTLLNDEVVVLLDQHAVHERIRSNESKYNTNTPLKELIILLCNDIYQNILDLGTETKILPKTIQDVLNSQACRGAIKFGDPLSLKECDDLIQDLQYCQTPFQCAHGRPSIAPIINLNTLKISSAYRKEQFYRILESQIELEKLNSSTDVINKLECDLDEARSRFRTLLNESTREMDGLSRRLGLCVEKARPYYEARKNARYALAEAQRAACRFEKASGAHEVAKEMVTLAEEGFQGKGIAFDTAWQEMLNHATGRVNDSEKERNESAEEHRQKSYEYQISERRVHDLLKSLKRSIIKSKPYFELKARSHQMLDDQKRQVQLIEETILMTKLGYSESLRELEKISEEIHEKRQKELHLHKNLGVREAGVGAEENVTEEQKDDIREIVKRKIKNSLSTDTVNYVKRDKSKGEFVNSSTQSNITNLAPSKCESDTSLKSSSKSPMNHIVINEGIPSSVSSSQSASDKTSSTSSSGIPSPKSSKLQKEEWRNCSSSNTITQMSCDVNYDDGSDNESLNSMEVIDDTQIDLLMKEDDIKSTFEEMFPSEIISSSSGKKQFQEV
ncbi:SH3 domain-binding protein 5 homolog,SH3 domain-binding protein 5-like,SH3 domain-binding protein 5 [Lepeophtheirus salmonis]|uniref:SH3 domain-binding protein 5 homolog,SH3 domain-binding protein 5-like,SH3 domain-binding protein 5 n=1 Tax=Lepeophtheirus salmonis TaxID=72036 RepID=A0A7R8CBL2_LEPSM|nr:SH3 domain-binding protein 5 homolog,SH3 domain-binding protein 5-like,SH3 domain-binding protein 5 [Lepeophtheirus salmonis]CAF2754097.1 SH3 domain-binding protein 5 homolog,SH3 domain-binding protein 5-like,SH3 domain-binding protein 5 [Lepeophtheirus salmonis]